MQFEIPLAIKKLMLPGWLIELREAIFGKYAEEIEAEYGPLARRAFDMGARGLAPHGRFAQGGAMFVFCLEGCRQHQNERNLSRRIARVAIERAMEGKDDVRATPL